MNSTSIMENRKVVDAVYRWVSTFDSIPTSAAVKLYMYDESVTEVTEPRDYEDDPEYVDDLDARFPMWGTMWRFSSAADECWMKEAGVGIMSSLGFRVYDSEDYGLIFGIDGAGYDFYEAFWVPLYFARGLHWHEMPEN